MALGTDGILGSLATSVHSAFDDAGAELQRLAAAVARLFAPPLQIATDFSDVVLQHPAVMITGVVAGAGAVVLVLLMIKLAHHSAATVLSKKPHKTAPGGPEAKKGLRQRSRHSLSCCA